LWRPGDSEVTDLRYTDAVAGFVGDINARDDAVGMLDDGNTQRPVLWESRGELTNLVGPDGEVGRGGAFRIADSAWIVGEIAGKGVVWARGRWSRRSCSRFPTACRTRLTRCMSPTTARWSGWRTTQWATSSLSIGHQTTRCPSRSERSGAATAARRQRSPRGEFSVAWGQPGPILCSGAWFQDRQPDHGPCSWHWPASMHTPQSADLALRGLNTKVGKERTGPPAADQGPGIPPGNFLSLAGSSRSRWTATGRLTSRNVTSPTPLDGIVHIRNA
jgi:hypothetical protein